MERARIYAIIGGVSVFVIILGITYYTHSDFDQQLIEEVKNGVPADELNLQIDKEFEKLKKDANRRYQSDVVNKDLNKGHLASKNDYQSYVEKYENELKMISKYEECCKKFARREISKEEFLQEIKTPKELLQLMY